MEKFATNGTGKIVFKYVQFYNQIYEYLCKINSHVNWNWRAQNEHVKKHSQIGMNKWERETKSTACTK